MSEPAEQSHYEKRKSELKENKGVDLQKRTWRLKNLGEEVK